MDVLMGIADWSLSLNVVETTERVQCTSFFCQLYNSIIYHPMLNLIREARM